MYTKTETDGLLVDKANANNVYTKYEVDTAKAHIRANLLQLAELLYDTKEVSDKFIATEENQTEFTLSNIPTENHLVKMYINGVLVGDNVTVDENINNNITTFHAVITVSNSTVNYRPEYNGNYQLRAGDRIVFYYYTILPSQGDSN